MKIIPAGVLCSLLLSTTKLQAQQDTLQQLPEVTVQSYYAHASLQRVPTAVSILLPADLQLQQGASLLPALNTVPGLRMEERSPGSYRLSIRGSLLRSPFGIRNIKIYIDDIPLTDAGGNTYLNLLDPDAIRRVEVLKGPDGSMFGANSGGVVRLGLAPEASDTTRLQLNLQGGSYGLFHGSIDWQQQWKNYQLQVFQGFQRADGYRQNTAMKRWYTQVAQRWEYKPGYALKMLAFYSDLSYRTPGGLTLAESKANPRAARPSTAAIPGAVAQQAGIYNRTFQGGLVHEAQFHPRLQHVVSVFGATTYFQNPFLTKYEVRVENTIGFRTYLQWISNPAHATAVNWKWLNGIEWQQTSTDDINYGNRGGRRDTVQTADKLYTGQHFFFSRFLATTGALTLEAAASLNYYGYRYNSDGHTSVHLSPQLMPRVSLSYLFTPGITGRVTVSRGYSPPATAEIRASDDVINNNLQPETGWNYEAGLRMATRNGRASMDATGFYYRMQNAIVLRRHANGNEYFVNAGGVRQKGIEWQGTWWVMKPRRQGVLRGIKWQEGYTFSDFHFTDYTSAGKDYSGNRLTGVPQHVVVSSILWLLPANVSLYTQHTYTSRIPLDDANSTFASDFHLLQANVSWKLPLHTRYSLLLRAGADNLLDVKYSLGNDLNAAGGRYYNPAPGRNYFGGLRLVL
ncbi:iron complex outermembrane receptor protein [Chitinophaga polysaccharea]|uniref:Iron complex outermembrane receptor protein n=1 Tax=Chitinophaga polysaccharea TaxID=1293035 RepID=A0A561PRK3_9BACT|nr:TonB-dependent receptor [Chitinophaga polysaccharea]TWF40755.1 iron complex outermembrane receptor protein [Chitinophaga polysaccharea]